MISSLFFFYIHYSIVSLKYLRANSSY